MDDISTAVIPEYDFIDSLPSLLRHNAGQLQNTPKNDSGPKNTLTRPLPSVNKPSIPLQNKKPVSCEGEDSISGGGVPHPVKKSSITIKHKQTAASHKSHCGPIPAAKKPNIPSKHINPSSTKTSQLKSNNSSARPSNEAKNQPPPTTNTSSDMEQIGVYQPLKSSQQTQDSVYEELNESTMKSTLADGDDRLKDRSVYEPLQGNIQNPTYEMLTLSDSSVNVQI